MKVILIGANHAGTSFIRTLKKLNSKIKVVVYERNTNTSFLGCGTALWVGGEFEDPSGLFYSSPEELTNKYGAKVHLSHEVIAVDIAKKEVSVKNLETEKIFIDTYDKLVYAGGTSPILPNLPGVDYKGILVAKLFQHAQIIHKWANKDKIKDVIVIGAGYIGIELVEAFHKKGKKVTLVDLQSRVIPNYFDVEFTDPLEQKMKDAGVKLQLGESVKEFISEDGTNVSTVVTDKGSYKTQLVIMAIGFRPNSARFSGFEKLQKLPNGAVRVDQFQRTLRDKNVYVIGDAAAVHHNASKDFANVALATNAVKTGLVAAFSIAGSPIPFPGMAGTNAISVFGCHFASTGFSSMGAKNAGFKTWNTEVLVDNDKPEFMQNHEKVTFKIVYDPKTLVLKGAQIGTFSHTANHTEVIFMISKAIKHRETLPEIVLSDFYFLPHYNKPFNFVIKTVLNGLGIKY